MGVTDAPPATTPVWGTGCYRDADGLPRSLTLSSEEFDREVEVAARRLRSWGFQPDDIVLVVGGVAEAVQFAPFQRAARLLGGISCTAEPSPFDARRTASFLTQFRLRAVIGLDAGVLDGLAQFGDAAQVLRHCDLLVARTNALARLGHLGLRPLALHVLGPAVAAECPHRTGAHVGADAWSVSAAEGRLMVERAPGRDLPAGLVDTGLPGRVDRTPCGCGSADPRVIVESAVAR